MANFGRFYVPPLGAAANVLWAAVKAYVPEDSPCMEAIAKRRGGGDQPAAADGGAAEQAAERSRLQSSGGRPDTNPFRTTCNSELSSYGGVEKCDGVDGGGGPAVKRTPQAFSMDDGSFDDDSAGGEFGRSRQKIDEWQAAWNVTNAIQVRYQHETREFTQKPNRGIRQKLGTGKFLLVFLVVAEIILVFNLDLPHRSNAFCFPITLESSHSYL